ncbi:hypothetical protein ACFMI7_09390, partial [Acinetobacter baumannii]
LNLRKAKIADNKKIYMIDGDVNAGAWSCGLVASLIHDIPTCDELVSRIVKEAEDIIRGRLLGLL